MTDKYQDGEYIIDPKRDIFERRWDDGLVMSSDRDNYFAHRVYKNNESKNIRIIDNWIIEEIHEDELNPEILAYRRRQVLKLLARNRIEKIAAE